MLSSTARMAHMAARTDLHILDLLPEQQQRRERARVGRLHVRLQRLVG